MRRRGPVLAIVGLLSAVAIPFASGAAAGGSIAGWGRDQYGQATPPAGEGFVQVSAGGKHSLALRADGSIAAWGYDGKHQVSDTPEEEGFVAVSAGGQHSLALRADGSITGWGMNTWGQAGDWGGRTGFVAVAAGSYHSVALRANGSVVAWGLNEYGQATAPEGNDFVAVAAGGFHSLALRADGSIVGWGWDGVGQASPPAGNDFVAIDAEGYNSVALRADGSVAAWGMGSYGATAPPAGTDFIAVAAGDLFGLALRADGSIVGWGWDGYGEASPPALSSFIALSAGGSHALGLVGTGSPGGFGKGAPEDEATGRGDAISLSWETAWGVLHYEYCLDTTDDDACAAWIDTGQAAGVDLSGLADATTYYWQARARNGLGATEADGGAWWSFTTGPPDAFAKAAPPDGAMNLSANAVLSWEAAEGASSYEYCVGTIGDAACTEWAAGGSKTSITAKGLVYAAPYSWQVRARNGFGVTEADGGVWWGFTTRDTPVFQEATFGSEGARDGWVREAAETSDRGDALDATSPTACVGDDGSDRQYRAVLDFDTSALPDDAVVTGVVMRVRRQGLTGVDPFTTHGVLQMDVKSGAFHDLAELERFDFQAVGSRGRAGRFYRADPDGWLRGVLRAPGHPLVDPAGHTQFRLRFGLADDDDLTADCLWFWTGDAPVAGDRPELTVIYYRP